MNPNQIPKNKLPEAEDNEVVTLYSKLQQLNQAHDHPSKFLMAVAKKIHALKEQHKWEMGQKDLQIQHLQGQIKAKKAQSSLF